MQRFACNQCGAPFVIDGNGIANHVDNEDGIDYDADGDHVPYGEEQYEKTYEWISSHGEICLTLSRQCVIDCSHSGQCVHDVEHWHGQMKDQFKDHSDEKIREVLKPYGDWDDDELQDRDLNEQRFIWLAAGDIRDDDVFED